MGSWEAVQGMTMEKYNDLGAAEDGEGAELNHRTVCVFFCMLWGLRIICSKTVDQRPGPTSADHDRWRCKNHTVEFLTKKNLVALQI